MIELSDYNNSKINFSYVLGFKVFSDKLDKIPLNSKQMILSTISPNSYGITTYDIKFKQALLCSDYLVLDGVYFGLGYFLKTLKTLVKNQGPDVTDFFLNKSNNESLKVFFMGSSQSTLNKIFQKVSYKYPGISDIGLYSPPFKENFTDYDNSLIISSINKFKPDILFIGMTCPKQEKWAFENKQHIDASLICNIGAVFDWIAGNEKQINPIWWKLRLAWLKRTIDRPEILKRYPNIMIYFRDMILDLLKLKNIK